MLRSVFSSYREILLKSAILVRKSLKHFRKLKLIQILSKQKMTTDYDTWIDEMQKLILAREENKKVSFNIKFCVSRAERVYFEETPSQ